MEFAAPVRKPSVKVMDQVRAELRAGHYSLQTERTTIQWIRQYILYHNKHRPETMSAEAANAFISRSHWDWKAASSMKMYNKRNKRPS